MSTGSSWAYTDTVKDHFMNPRNVLDDEDAYPHDGRGLVGNRVCGDEMLVVIRVDRDKGTIADCRWRTYGCASAIASTSVLSEMVKGMPIEEARRITPKDVAAALGSLPEHKVHCSVLGDKALREAINDYYRRTGREDLAQEPAAELVCHCMGVTDQDIKDAVRDGAHTFYELQERTKVCTGCGSCRPEVERLLEQFLHETETRSTQQEAR